MTVSNDPSFVSGSKDSPLLELTIGALLARACDAAPDGEALAGFLPPEHTAYL
jgi:hypothetical protein